MINKRDIDDFVHRYDNNKSGTMTWNGIRFKRRCNYGVSEQKINKMGRNHKFYLYSSVFLDRGVLSGQTGS